MTEAVIGDISGEKVGSTHRVISQFDGEPAWFESDEVELEPSIEAFGSLWLTPCILSNRDLRLEKPVCKTWYENAHKFIEFYSNCWGTAKIKIHAETYQSSTVRQQAEAVCFSGGVDSFYTLMKRGSPKYLLRAEGIDPSASRAKEFRIARERLAKIATAVGAFPVVIRYNLFEHPSFKIHDDIDTYTGIFACMGHLLSSQIGSIFISSSNHKDDITPHACFTITNPLYSSARLEVNHYPADVSRRDKVAAIADWQLANDNLYVCLQRRGSNRNCSQCEKCVRTMLDLHIIGKLESFKAFDQMKPLWEAMDHVQSVPECATYHSALVEPLDPRIAAGIWRMLRREYVRVWRLQEADSKMRYLEKELADMKEGLAKALHHYSLLQENYNNLLKDYKEVVENRPLRRGVRAVRHVMRMLR